MVVKLVNPKKSRVFKPVLENEFFDSLAKIKIANKIAVAVSGGPDSLALTILLHKYALKNKIQMYAFSIDHGLRNASIAELKWLNSQLKKRKINHKIIKWKNTKPKSNIQAQARNKRYELLIKACDEINTKFLFTGHHFDDQVENILLRLIRGSGIKGLGSLKEKIKFNNSKITIIRPLLNYPKKSLISYLASENQKYILDPTNFDNNFDRSRIRKVTQHLINEGFDSKMLAKTIKNLKDANISVNYLINKSIKKFLHVNEYGLLFIALPKFKSLPDEIKFRSISNILKLVGRSNYIPRSKNILNLLNYLKNNESMQITIAGCLVQIENNKMMVFPEVSRKLHELNIKSRDFVWNDQFHVYMQNDYAKGLIIRYLGKEGIEHLPSRYKKKLCQHDYAPYYLSIWKNSKLIAVPDIGYSDKKEKSIRKYELNNVYELLTEQ